MPLITADAHCPTFPRLGSSPGSLAMHQCPEEVWPWNSSSRPLDALKNRLLQYCQGAHGQGSPWGTNTSGSCFSGAARVPLADRETTRLPTRERGCQEWDTGLGSHSSMRACWGTLPRGGFGWTLDGNHVSEGSFFAVQSRKCQADNSSFLFSCRFFTSSLFPSPWQGSSEQEFSTSYHYTFTSSLPGNFPSISTAALPSKRAQIIFPVNI